MFLSNFLLRRKLQSSGEVTFDLSEELRKGDFDSLSDHHNRNRFLSSISRVHHDQNGAVSLETVLIIGGIVLPVLIFLIKFGWPRIRDYFQRGLDVIEIESEQAILP